MIGKTNQKPLSEARDADARNTLAALTRAAEKARELAARTSTPLVTTTRGPLSRQPGQPAG